MNLADRDFLAFSLKLSSFFWDQSTHSLAATLAVLEPLSGLSQLSGDACCAGGAGARCQEHGPGHLARPDLVLVAPLLLPVRHLHQG